MNSPLFISSIELLAHSTELYAQKNDKKGKFIILHLANAVELILKDKLIVSGNSIYEKNNPTRTLGIWECFKDLDRLMVLIPERPIIELLIDDRNTIQHRFGYPNGESVYYYITEIVNFFKRFLASEYDINLVDELSPYLKKEHLTLLGLAEDENHQLNKLKEISPEMALLSAYSQIEKELNQIKKGFEERHFLVSFKQPIIILDNFIAFLIKNGKLSEDISEFYNLKSLRNKIAHGALKEEDITAERLKHYVDLCKRVLNSISTAKEEGYFTDDRIKEILIIADIENLPKELKNIQGLGERLIYTNLKGGRFYINEKGNKVYIPKDMS